MKFSESMKLSRFSFCLLVVALGVSGCATKSPAPVAERVRPPAAAVDKPEVPVAPPRVARPGYYIVKPGDTLIRIALDNGQNYRDIAAWSGLENPNLIEVGQARVQQVAGRLRRVGGDESLVRFAAPFFGAAIDKNPLLNAVVVDIAFGDGESIDGESEAFGGEASKCF